MAKIILRAGKVAIKIIIPFVILGLIFYSVKVLVPAKASVESFPEELVAQFEQAETYQEEGQYGEAEQIYQDIITQYPGTDYHFEAQRQLTMLYIWDRPAEADAALEELTSIFYEHPGIAQSVYDIAEWYREFNPGKAIEIFQYALDTWPESEHAMWAQSGLVQSYLALGDEAAAQAAIEKLLTAYSEDENIQDIVIYIANEYWPSSPQALELFEYAISTWPDNKDAIWARAGLIRANIVLGNDPNVPEAVDELLEQFSGSEFIVEAVISEAVISIADSCYEVRKYENALELYEYAMRTWPDNKDAIWAQAGLIRANIALGNDPDVAEVVDALVERFSESEGIVEALCSIAKSYYEDRNYEDAQRLHQFSLDNFPGSKEIIWARAGLIKSNIALANDPNVTEELDELIGEFAFNPGLPDAILETGLAYYNKARYRAMDGDNEGEKAFYRDAISIYERVINEFEYSGFSGSAYFRAGLLYAQELGEYEKGIDYFQAAVDSRPVYAHAWAAQFLVGRYYEKLRDTGAVAEPEANALAKAAYEAVLEDYPDSYWAENAQLKLDRMTYEETNQ